MKMNKEEAKAEAKRREAEEKEETRRKLHLINI